MIPSGILLYDKPAGVTSHDVVAAVRRRLGGRRAKVGHAGTLDPFATGLLLVLVGRATRAQRYFMALPKTYEVTARFGAVSSTGDPEGSIVPTGVVPSGDLTLPVGVVRQRPPAYSAVKVSGRRAYSLARAGEAVELAEREVFVHRFDEVRREGDRRSFVIECSSGTYVRSLIGDLGDAYCESLRRVRIGPFAVADAGPERLVELGEALGFLPEVRLEGDAARRAGHGGVVVGEAGGAVGGHGGGAVGGEAGGAVRLTDERGLIAIAEPAGAGRLKPVVGFRG